MVKILQIRHSGKVSVLRDDEAVYLKQGDQITEDEEATLAVEHGAVVYEFDDGTLIERYAEPIDAEQKIVRKSGKE